MGELGMNASLDLVNMFLAHQRGRSFSEYTIRRRGYSLGSFLRWIAPMSIDDVDGPTIEEWVASHRAARTRHAYRCDVSSFYQWAQRRHLVARNPVVDTDPIRVPKGLPRPLPAAAVRLVIDSARDADMRMALSLAAYAGLRRSEIVHLSTDDLALEAAPPILEVRNGKWAKDRIVPLHPELSRMLDRRRIQGRVVPLTADNLGRRAATHIRSCGYDRTIHSLRATFATELSRVTGGNLQVVGELLGHESLETTAGYVKMSDGSAYGPVCSMYGGDAA